MIRWAALVVGASTFVAAHLAEVLAWTTWFGPQHAPWFLNSGRAAAFTAGCLLIVSVLTGISTGGDYRESMIRGGNLAAGAFIAMVCVLVVIGAGTIFPIVLAFGAVVALTTGVLGALAGWRAKAWTASVLKK